MNGTWGSDYAEITVEPDQLREYATRCTEAAGLFSPDSFLSGTTIPESAFSSWRSFSDVAVKYGHGLPEMTAEGLSETYNEIQNATFVRLLAISDTIEELALAVRQTAEAVEIQDASASSSIDATLDTDIDVAAGTQADW